ncbi:hypothetical protein ACFPN2_22960 [Steroidobacter flavus]|uniref:Uncharacterized protein n=1 Tax=Steroidobacter flavus TaxID=1842136 RepID=A0ABV8SWM8_9GAMM
MEIYRRASDADPQSRLKLTDRINFLTICMERALPVAHDPIALWSAGRPAS